MKYLFFTVLLSFLCFSGVKAQKSISFAYDASGNRVARIIILNHTIAFNEKTEENRDESQMFNEILGNTQVKLYPNPVESILSISIRSLENDGGKGKYFLYDMNGSLILQGALNNHETKVDMSRLPSGNYAMRLVINKEQSSWKIIKK